MPEEIRQLVRVGDTREVTLNRMARHLVDARRDTSDRSQNYGNFSQPFLMLSNVKHPFGSPPGKTRLQQNQIRWSTSQMGKTFDPSHCRRDGEAP